MSFSLPIVPEANALLDRDPLAVVIGLTLDQQVTMEKAFTSPHVLVQRLGHEPTAAELADFDADDLLAIFATPPALHRFPKAMAARVQEVCRVIVDRYDGDPAALWRDVSDGADLFKRIVSLPGFGKQKAQIFVALLGKQYGVQPAGWREAAGGYGEEGAYRSVADIVDDESLAKVRAYKKEMKAAAKV
ncbi:HhH-GPD-type base excision DNA repair protein [Micromonospora sp. NBC_01796]|uniref:HhH-GPD-type base excision DNA repair protein n=1 Tax=Micromonospora sp. NBC_01796 TaxID=2975987 RepID=UPI002DDC0D48|nr:HhH-GPD-type base excision DNA repair protein [Micromonospora sp. NBC_01796]WSA86881.1 Fe-S cluster assembly protein HesB [Micromonospora sp. NBC_01796]